MSAVQDVPAGFAYGGTGGGSVDEGLDPTMAHTAPSYFQERPSAPRKERSYLGLFTLLAAVVVAGLMGAGAAAGLFPLSPIVFFAVLLAIVATGLIIGAFRGRARWLAIPAVLLALLTAASVPAVRFADSLDGGVGSPVWQPTSAASPFVLGAGSATLDLTTWAANPSLPPPTQATTINADVRYGEIVVLIPKTWQVTVKADVGTGDISLNNQLLAGQNGRGMVYDGVLEPVGAQTGAITLNLHTGVGTIGIEQVSVPPEVGAAPSATASIPAAPIATPTITPATP